MKNFLIDCLHELALTLFRFTPFAKSNDSQAYCRRSLTNKYVLLFSIVFQLEEFRISLRNGIEKQFAHSLKPSYMLTVNGMNENQLRIKLTYATQ